MNKFLSKCLLSLMFFCASSLTQVAGAKEITGVTVNPSTAKITSPNGVNVKITIHADTDPPTFCGLRIEYGGGIAGENVKIDSNEGLFPRIMTKTFTEPGTYTIRVAGRKVTTHLPCLGKASAVLIVERGAAEKPVQPALPEQKFFRSWF